jgi:hemerythrin
MDTEGISSRLVIDLQSFLVDWLINHISKVDKALGSFLSTKK